MIAEVLVALVAIKVGFNMYQLQRRALSNPALFADSYKLSHKAMEPEGTEIIYSNFTPRFNKYFKELYPNHDGKTVVFGIYPFLLDFLVDYWEKGFFKRPKEEVLEEIREVCYPYVGMDTKDLKHFEDLHDLGHLPLRVKALPEGSTVNTNIPVLTVVNTHKNFSWLTNYIESVLSSELWKPMTVATFAREFNTLADYWFDKTVEDQTFRKFAIHDFSYRGHGTHRESAICGAAPLLFSNGTDNIPGVLLARALYGADENVAGSVAASEHSVTTLGINFFADQKFDGELKTLTDQLLNKMIALGIQFEYEKALGELVTIYRLLTEVYPTGIFSYVSDSYDYWRVLTVILPILKPVIMRRDGKLVVRPDSGDPVKIVCGEVTPAQATLIPESSMEFCEDFCKEVLIDRLVDETPHGYSGPSSFEGLFVDSDGTYFKAVISDISWNRYDKQYYYLDDRHSITCIVETIDLNPAEKGSIEVLSEVFGYTTNAKGYKELPPQIGLIYGDGITYQRAKDIYSQLASKGFAANNVVLGVGSYSFSGGTRDTLGFAIKATYAEVNGKPTPIYKEPKTDMSKKSARGLMKIEQDANGELVLVDNCSWAEEAEGLLQVVFENGKLYNQPDFTAIRTRLGFYE